MSVALHTQPEKRMCLMYCQLWPVWFCDIQSDELWIRVIRLLLSLWK